jgi:DNA replication protein DnaC
MGMSFVYASKDGKTNYSKVIPCKCVKKKIEEERRMALLKLCELPPFACDMTFDNFKIYPAVKSAYEEAKSMASKPGELYWLALLSLNGTGKTHLAISICKAWIKAGIPTKYIFASLLLDELREGFKKDKEQSYESRYQYYCNVPLLMIDDYGVESSTPWVQEKFDTILDYRLMHNLSLIVTSNNSLDEMPPRIRSRLMRHPKSKIITIMAEDYATRIKSEKMSR